MMDGVSNVSDTYGDSQLGGKDFDQALVNLTIRMFKEQDLIVPYRQKLIRN